MEQTQSKNLSKSRNSALQMHLFSFDQQGANQFGEPLQGAGITTNMWILRT